MAAAQQEGDDGRAGDGFFEKAVIYISIYICMYHPPATTTMTMTTAMMMMTVTVTIFYL